MAAGHCGKFGTQVLLLAASLSAGASAQQKQVLRWSEGQSDSAFRANDDGIYRYGLAAKDFVVTLAVDSQELDKARRRIEPVLGLFLSVRFLNQNSIGFNPASITLEFAKHFHEKEVPLDTERLSRQLAVDREAASARAATDIRKHPAQKNEIEAGLKDEQHNIDQMIDFLHARMLRRSVPQDREIVGWLLFPTKSRWIGQLNKQEEFVLRIPLGNVVAEFPLTLPPSQADIHLRTRPQE